MSIPESFLPEKQPKTGPRGLDGEAVFDQFDPVDAIKRMTRLRVLADGAALQVRDAVGSAYPDQQLMRSLDRAQASLRSASRRAGKLRDRAEARLEQALKNGGDHEQHE